MIRAVKFGIGTVTPVLSAHSDGTLLTTGVKKSLMIAKIMIRKMVPVPIVIRATLSKMINVLRLKQIIVRKKSTASVSFVILVIELSMVSAFSPILSAKLLRLKGFVRLAMKLMFCTNAFAYLWSNW